MELPTYTNIWKIEKRLYKLYDFRLPMPLPVGQLATFLAIAVPYMLILTMVGMPFSHTWVWLYVLPPGVLAWLVTRPVLEGKRLPELVLSQLRYLSEPRTWCRMAPLAEQDVITVVATVWRRPSAAAAAQAPAAPAPAAPALAAAAAAAQAPAAPALARVALREDALVGDDAAGEGRLAQAEPQSARAEAQSARAEPQSARAKARSAQAERQSVRAERQSVRAEPQSARAEPQSARAEPQSARAEPQSARADAQSAQPERQSAQAEQQPAPAERRSEPDGTALPERPVWPGHPALGSRGRTGQAETAWAPAAPQRESRAPAPAPQTQPQTDTHAAPVETAGLAETGGLAETAGRAETAGLAETAGRPAAAASSPGRPARERQPGASRAGSGTAHPALIVRTDASAGQPLRVVERALRSSTGAPGSGWRDRVVVVPGGHRPGKPDQVQRDEARAQLPLTGPARIVVLGCTAGAGQTVTTLLTGQLLATLRGEPVAVLDLSPGPGSLTELARGIPRLFPGRAGVAETARGSDGPVSDRERRLQVVTADGNAAEPRDAGQLMAAVVARYPLTLADPAAAQVPTALEAADQLLLVAPASPDAGGALAMTLEWLDAHGHADLGQTAVTVLNGVSDQTMVHAEKAALVATGRCRAIVRVPWDSRLSGKSLSGGGPVRDGEALDGAVRDAALGPAPLSANTVQAYTALAGVLVAGLVGRSAEE